MTLSSCTSLLVTKLTKSPSTVIITTTHAMIPILSLQSYPSHELVKLTAANFFLRNIRQKNAFRLEHRCVAGEQIDVIADEHKTLLYYAYESKSVLKEAIDSLSSRSSFKDGWSLLGSWLPNPMEYCGAVVATLFPGTSSVESNDFSIFHWEKDCFRKGLSVFGIERVLQAKQELLFIEEFEKCQIN